MFPSRKALPSRHIILSMTGPAHELLQKALTLSDAERAELAGNLIASLDAIQDPDVDAAWQEEIARRFREVQSGKVKTVSWQSAIKKGQSLLDGR
jgi:putative addiction module component (TIGR02574 family)